MSERETTTELVKRLEAGETGRDLDAIIWYTMVEKPGPGEKIDRDMIDRWPAYTTSLDAAVALVERVRPGCWWQAERQYVYDKGALREQGVGRVRAEGSTRLHVVACPTPAAALIAALLKAKGAGALPSPHTEKEG